MTGPAPLDGGMAAFVVAENHIINADAYKDYAGRVLATLVPHGGVVIARAGESVSFEGSSPGRIVLIRFDSLERARAWWDSDAYQAIVPLRLKAAVGRVYVVEGLARAADATG